MAVKASNSFADLSKKLKARAKDIADRVAALKGKNVQVGIPESSTYPNGKSVREVAELISYGVLENGRPMSMGPRRFVYIATEKNKAKWNRMLSDGVREAMRARKKPNLRPLMIRIGEEIQKDIRHQMIEMEVWDTGRMHNSISILQINNQTIQT